VQPVFVWEIRGGACQLVWRVSSWTVCVAKFTRLSILPDGRVQ
jgi:hypothetical protein